MEKFHIKERGNKDIENMARLIGQHWAEVCKDIAYTRDNPIEVSITLNGVEISFSEFFSAIENGFEQSVKEAAYKLFQDKCEGLMDLLNKLHTDLDIIRSKSCWIIIKE